MRFQCVLSILFKYEQIRWFFTQTYSDVDIVSMNHIDESSKFCTVQDY
jgi:hypothetical protein